MLIVDIIDSYMNGQKKQMTNFIRDYGASQFFIDLAPFINEFYDYDLELYVAICIAYHSNVKPGMLVT